MSWQALLFSRVRKVRRTGCWILQAPTNRDGYTRYTGPYVVKKDGRRSDFGHRWAYRAAHGSIPDGLEVDHLCNVRACINPDHLEAVTREENNRRRDERTTHCRNGHPYSPGNTAWSGKYRRCKTCRRDWERARSSASSTGTPQGEIRSA